MPYNIKLQAIFLNIHCISRDIIHIYIIQATNGAGLSSYTVSSEFVIDSSPPEIGHVMDVLLSFDINQV